MFGLPASVGFASVAAAGRLAQRLAHLVYTEVVGGSNPSAPTTFPKTLVSTRFNRTMARMSKSALQLFLLLLMTFAAHGKPSLTHETGKAKKTADMPMDLDLTEGQPQPTNAAPQTPPKAAKNTPPRKVNAVAPTNSVPAPSAPAYMVPTENWVALDRWAKQNKLPGLENLSTPGAPLYELRAPIGSFQIRPGSNLAAWSGLELRLGFEPQLIADTPLLHRLDLEKNLVPLLVGGAPHVTAQRVIVLDPGHGGTDSGTRSAEGDLEKDHTLDWALRLASLLRTQGWTVALTRTNDTQMSLADRVTFTDRHRADLFLSLHFNATTQPYHAGIETYCVTPMGMPSNVTRSYEDNTTLVFPNNLFDAQNLQLALNIHRAILKATGGRDRGVRRARFLSVLRAQNRPAVLIEGGYLSNPDEAKLIISEDYRQKLAQAVADALK